jgi:hypothetical protein
MPSCWAYFRICILVNFVINSADKGNMRKFLLKSILFFVCFFVTAKTKPMYRLPENAAVNTNISLEDGYFLAGTDSGLYGVHEDGNTVPLWNEGKVLQIVKTVTINEDGLKTAKWFFRTDKGIYVSYDLLVFTASNEGLPVQILKEYDGKEKTLLERSAPLVDLSADPLDSNLLVTATKDQVYYTSDGGKNWQAIGSISDSTTGIKAVAIAHMNVYADDGSITGSERVAFLSHSLYGLSYKRLDVKNPKWTEAHGGLKIQETQSTPDEVADIAPVLVKDANGALYTDIYLSQSFFPIIYRFDWKVKRSIQVYQASSCADTIDSLCQINNSLAYVTPGAVRSLSLADYKVKEASGQFAWIKQLKLLHSNPNAVYIPAKLCGLENPLQLNELWLLKPNPVLSQYSDKICDMRSIYIPANHLTSASGIAKYEKIIKTKNLNSFVVDMKDDYGLIRFEPKSEIIKKKCYVSRYKIDIDKIAKTFKENGVKMIARIVVFKDKHLSTWDKKQYAVWNVNTNAPWVGIRGYEDVLDEEGNVTGKKAKFYDENWVDPYCEEVWEYNVAIAKELIERGFDEIQFDYIRFPTDGTNMGSIKYRWRESGMYKGDALESFLLYARKNIDAPIGVDIYGANGWYRTASRTGQDVEMMSNYVDIICPMFYPSHFNQSFLAYNAKAERPYRIYYYGTYRNSVIGRNNIVVRPWVQAFYLNVSYDREYYNENYVKREVFGVRDSVNRGYMYWNNVGRYDDIPLSPTDEDVYPWTSQSTEASLERRPAFSSVNHKAGQVDADEVEKMQEAKRNELKNTVLSNTLNVITTVTN